MTHDTGQRSAANEIVQQFVASNGKRVEVKRGKAGLYYATSPDDRGLLVAEPTLEGLAEHVDRALAALDQARAEAKWCGF